MSAVRNDPPIEKIFAWWWDLAATDPEQVNAVSAPFLMDPGEPPCFACGWRVPDTDDEPRLLPRWRAAGAFLERAHLADHCRGGTNHPSNYVPLCRMCHMEMTANVSTADRDEALRWVVAHPIRDQFFGLVTDAVFAGAQSRRKQHHYVLTQWIRYSSQLRTDREEALAGLAASYEGGDL